MLVAGGLGSSYARNAELYDPSRGRWRSTGAMTTARAGALVSLLSNGTVLVAGGDNPSGLQSAEIYNPGTRTWRATGSMTSYHVRGVSVRLQDGRVLAVGGNSQVGDVYSPATGTWTATGTLANINLLDAGAALLPNGQVLYTGGDQTICPGYEYCYQQDYASAELDTP